MTLQLEEEVGWRGLVNPDLQTGEDEVSAQSIYELCVIVMSQKEAQVSCPPSKKRDLDDREEGTVQDEVSAQKFDVQLCDCDVADGGSRQLSSGKEKGVGRMRA